MKYSAKNFGLHLVKSLHPDRSAFSPFPNKAIEQSLPARFEEIVNRHPHQVAIRYPTHHFSYTEINRAANNLGKVLVSQCNPKNRLPIALLVEQGATQVSATLGILKSGQCCVQLDPTYPRSRLQHYLNHSQAKVVVTNSESFRLTKSLAKSTHRILNLDHLNLTDPTDNLGIPIKANAPAFILYTSGSTGEPKGVIHSHCTIQFDVRRQTNDLLVYPGDRFGLVFSSCSSGSLPPIWGALLTGSTVCPFDLKLKGLAPLTHWLRKEKITICDLPVSAFRHLAEELSGKHNFPKLRILALVGEPISQYEVHLFQERFHKHCVLQNALGSTETRTISQFFLGKNTPFHATSVPAGYPIAGKTVTILDQKNQPVGWTTVGQIAVTSSFISSGYWRNRQMTNKVFLKTAKTDQPTYLTGDLGLQEPDGCLTCLGRIDSQVKIRGYRVEVAEVELALMKLAKVKDAVVVGLDHPRGGKYLVAYVVPKQNPAPRQSYLRQTLAEIFPDFMVPTALVIKKSLPLTPNGKIDRKKLPLPPLARRSASRRYEPPRGRLEQWVSKIMRESLGLERVGRRDHFFDLGGHSLLASQVMDKIEKKWKIQISPIQFFKSPTVAGLSREIQNTQEKTIPRQRYTLSVSQSKASNLRNIASNKKQAIRGRT